jgi:hypothetical protein
VAVRTVMEAPTKVRLVRFVLRGGEIQNAFEAALESASRRDQQPDR